jgi:HKD family nuclease
MTEVVIAGPGGMLQAVREVVADADEALLCVAFANQAGVELLAPALARVGGPVRLLATTVFGGTTGSALQRASDLGVEVRVLNLPRGTYHPKLYLARSGADARAFVGSANLTSGLLRNIEVGAVLQGDGESSALRQLRELGESWWEHPLTRPWERELVLAEVDLVVPDLWELLRLAVTPGTVVHTIAEGAPNRAVEISREAVWIETERSARLGRGPEAVPAWMLNVAWDHLVANGTLTNAFLVANNGRRSTGTRATSCRTSSRTSSTARPPCPTSNVPSSGPPPRSGTCSTRCTGATPSAR